MAYAVSSFLGDENYASESKVVYEHFRNKGYDAIPDVHDRLSGTSNTAIIVINPDKLELTSSTVITKDIMKEAKNYIKRLLRKEGTMASTNIILEDVKKQVGLIPEYDAFDDQLLMDINAAFATLHQLGVGPANGFLVDNTTTWEDYISTQRLAFIKSYVSMKVKLMFDPPTSSFALDALNKQIAEYEWRINSEVECFGQED